MLSFGCMINIRHPRQSRLRRNFLTNATPTRRTDATEARIAALVFSSSKKSQTLWSKMYVNKHAIDYTVYKNSHKQKTAEHTLSTNTTPVISNTISIYSHAQSLLNHPNSHKCHNKPSSRSREKTQPLWQCVHSIHKVPYTFTKTSKSH